MRYVRWLGAFRRSDSAVAEGARWELTQRTREIACEPLWRGQSLLLAEVDHVAVGLVIDPRASRFVAGFLTDCHSSPSPNTGRLHTRKQRPIWDQDRFAAAWDKSRPGRHGEVFFDLPVFSAVALALGSGRRAAQQAKDLAASLGLPVVTVRAVKEERMT